MAICDAARDCILDVGWKRTTLTDVARRAGVSRMTIYRTWPDMQTLLADLMTREWAGSWPPRSPTPAARPRRSPTAWSPAVRALRGNPLFRRIVDVDPELVLPYLLDRRGRSQQADPRRCWPSRSPRPGDGAVRAGDPQLLARTRRPGRPRLRRCRPTP